MKKVIKRINLVFFGIIFCTSVFCKPAFQMSFAVRSSNLIDKIQTLEDVDSFLMNNIHSPYIIKMKQEEPTYSFQIKLKQIQDYFMDSLNIRQFYKQDFDKDGRTDLLLNAFWRGRSAGFVILDKGNGIFSLKPFIDGKGNRMNIVLIRPDEIAGSSCLDYFLVEMNRLVDSIPLMNVNEKYKTGFLQKEDLVYKFKSFVEINENPAPFNFKDISFQIGGIFAMYPHYSIQIFENRKIYLRVEGANKDLGAPKDPGVYYARLSKKEFQFLKRMLAYFDLSKLKNFYDINRADPPYCTLQIRISESDSLKILDRGLQGSFGLQALYAHFGKLYNTLKWKKVNTQLNWNPVGGTI